MRVWSVKAPADFLVKLDPLVDLKLLQASRIKIALVQIICLKIRALSTSKVMYSLGSLIINLWINL